DLLAPTGWPERWYRWPLWLLSRSWDLACLCILLAVVAAIPIVQLASLGYLLDSAARLARRQAWSSALPGMRLAGRVGMLALLVFLLRLPVAFVSDLSYSAQLLLPNSREASLWRATAFALMLAFVIHVVWATMRGGKLRHFLWPAPLRFVREFFRRSTWQRASDQLYDLVSHFQFPRLWYLGARAGVGALVWIFIPVTMMIIGQRAENFPAAALVGLIGAIAMLVIVMVLPFLQIQMALHNRFRALFEVRQVRRRFLCAPWAHASALLLLCLLCIPLYLLRIEATPAELVWAPSIVFVIFMLPAKLLLGAAMGYAEGRAERLPLPNRHWTLRWPARVVVLASALLYVGALYVAQLVAGQGALVMYFQHAFLVPAPLISS
ncbi:MAG: hypothetical protein KDA72_18100, partial [Planctomycetales bacterium]|nr:hypothetical protein [Planctomycetales bacterium]